MVSQRTLGEVIAARSWSSASSEVFQWMADLLRREGVNICDASEDQLVRGTPVYALADADVEVVGRLMARYHIRRVPVLGDGMLVGLVDIVELALHAEYLASGNVGDEEGAV